VATEKTTRFVVSVQISGNETTAVEKHEERVRATGLGRRVVTHPERSSRTWNGKIPHGAYGGGLAHVFQGFLAHPGAGNLRRFGAKGLTSTPLPCRQGQLHLRIERLAVDANRGFHRQALLESAGKPKESTRNDDFGTLGQRFHGVLSRTSVAAQARVRTEVLTIRTLTSRVKIPSHDTQSRRHPPQERYQAPDEDGDHRR
jgi:hypothetical protein